MRRIKFFTFGCKANQYDTQLFSEVLSKIGYEIDRYNYEIAIINSCCVTKKAENEVKRLIRKTIDDKKEVWITGCLVEKDNLKAIFPTAKILSREGFYKMAKSLGVYGIKKFLGHARAFVKIVDGCENFCSYCIVPYVRGKISSRSISEIVDEIKALVENSYKEIVLTGIDVGGFGKDTGQSLKKLFEQVNEIEGLYRFRLSSIEVYYLTDEIIQTLRNCWKFCPSFHIPLQSGSDRILKLMKRPYTYDGYRKRIEKIKDVFGDVTLTTDVMVGFPEETEKDFEKTLRAVNECRFLKIHVFPFSLHPQTQAASFDRRVPECVKKERLKMLVKNGEDVAKEVKSGFIGKKCKVLVEEKIENYWFGYSEYYVPVLVDSSEELKGTIVSVIPEKLIEMKNNTYLYTRTILP
ncbi:MAG: MiaB/RimO family radical SAM methylthiotransferase [Candidatus Omnitrophica bacterium]|nr:MiaB/RimO family radical SAM methylthiotransferase [Candidatus Omnitrophota bacterium]